VAEEYAQDASSLVQYIKSLPVHSDERHIIESLYAKALSIVWAVVCGVAVLGLLTSLLSKAYTMSQAFNSDQGIQTEKSDPADVDVEASTLGSESRPDSRVSVTPTAVEIPR
jgi:hypothetical protein